MTFPSATEKAAQLIPGCRYRIHFDDCCVEGHFDAVFINCELDEDGEGTEFHFDIATIGPGWGAWRIEEIR